FDVLPIPAAVFTLSNVRVSPEEVGAGDEVTVTADLVNSGDAAGSQTVTLQVNGATEASQDFTVSAGEQRTVEFTVTRDDLGVYNVDIGGQASSFEVVAAPGGAMGMIVGIVIVLMVMLMGGGGAAYYFLVMRNRPPDDAAQLAS
ncbi:MAG: CARDB domain-containing protein, partial [Dehalococcoidia bacterium]